MTEALPSGQEQVQALTVGLIWQAIISNPPCYGHVHCAEKLQIPMHLLFTMPWSPTKVGHNALFRNQGLECMATVLQHDDVPCSVWSIVTAGFDWGRGEEWTQMLLE